MSRIVRGYAVPWEQEPTDDRGNRELAPGAIDPNWIGNVTLLWGTHDGEQFAQTRNGSMTLFSDSFGLGFEAELSTREGVVSLVNTLARSPMGCSIQATHMDLNAAGRVTKARIDHIALVPDPAYASTAAWLVGDDGRPYGRGVDEFTRTLAARWDRGFKAFSTLCDENRGVGVVAQSRAGASYPLGNGQGRGAARPAPHSRPMVPASVIAVLASASLLQFPRGPR